MVEDHLVPAHHREDAIAGGEFLPRRPFGFAVLAVALELGRHGLFLLGGRFCPAPYATRRGGHTIPPRLSASARSGTEQPRRPARGLAFRPNSFYEIGRA